VKLIDTREGEILSGIAPVVANEEEEAAAEGDATI
jgi:hypothetical protein